MRKHVAGIKKAVEEKSAVYNKVSVIMAHELSFVAMFALLKRTSFECLMSMLETDKPIKNCYVMPLPASVLTFEVYQAKEDPALYIDVKYLGDKRVDFCDKGVDEKCTLDEFLKSLDGMMLKKDVAAMREEFCIYRNYTKKQQLIGILLFCLAVVLFLLAMIWKVLRKNW